METKLVFIVWSKHSRRAETLADELNGRVSFYFEDRLKGRWLTPLRYLVQSWKTWRFLERERPEIVMVQLPPIFALMIVTTWCELHSSASSRILYAIDCHTGTFYDRRWSWALPLLRRLSRRAAITLVASEAALKILQSWKIKSLFLVDGLPRFSATASEIGSEGEERVAVISGYGTDEPLPELFAAAGLMPRVTFYFSGDSERLATSLLAQKPENVILTGFLPDSEYTALLKNVHGIVDLTREPNILTCGTYEALAIGKPVVVSDRPQMRRYFPRGFIYVNNTPEDVAAGVKKMLDQRSMLTTEVIAMRSELICRRQPSFNELAVLLQL